MAENVDRLDAPFTGLITFLRVPARTDFKTLDADIAILGAPTDEGSPWCPGARFGPRVIREMSVRAVGAWGMSPAENRYGYFDLEEDRHFLEREFRLRRIADCGDVDIIHTNVEQTFANITADVRSILRAGAMPIVLGGDHAITYPVVRAFSGPLDIIHFDAHLDYSPYRHGIQFDNGTQIRLIADLPNVGHIVQVGIRSLRHFEVDYRASKDRGNDVVTVKKVRQRGIESVFEHLQSDRPVYVSIDIDVLDMPLVPGCSSAEVGGFDYGELKEILTFIASRHEVVGLDLVEVNPLLDGAGKHTSLIAAQLIQEFMARIVENEKWKERHRVLTKTDVTAEVSSALKG